MFCGCRQWEVIPLESQSREQSRNPRVTAWTKVQPAWHSRALFCQMFLQIVTQTEPSLEAFKNLLKKVRCSFLHFPLNTHSIHIPGTQLMGPREEQNSVQAQEVHYCKRNLTRTFVTGSRCCTRDAYKAICSTRSHLYLVQQGVWRCISATQWLVFLHLIDIFRPLYERGSL